MHISRLIKIFFPCITRIYVQKLYESSLNLFYVLSDILNFHGKIIKDFYPRVLHSLLIYIVKFAWGRYKLLLCQVSIMWFSPFVEKRFLFWTTNTTKYNRYCDVRAKIFNFLNNFLHETIYPHNSIILIASFVC